jgi:hypothetical protein
MVVFSVKPSAFFLVLYPYWDFSCAWEHRWVPGALAARVLPGRAWALIVVVVVVMVVVGVLKKVMMRGVMKWNLDPGMLIL